MEEKNKVAIIVAVVGTVGSIIGAVLGNNYGQSQQNQYIESQVSNVEGDNNTVTINNVDDLVNEYNNLLSENKSLKEKNTSYFNDLTDIKSKLNKLETQMDDVPQIFYKNLSLMLDGTDLSINSNNSMVTIDGREYFSKEITEKLLPNNKSMTIKDDSIFVGKVISDKAKLSEQWVVNQEYCSTDFIGKDSYGNSHTNAIIFTYYDGSIVYNLNRKYSYLKCNISMYEGYSMNSATSLTITPDTGEAYSIQLNKTTEPFDVEIPINNCSLLTIECSGGSDEDNIIISNAILYN